MQATDRYRIRWTIRADLPALVAIECESFQAEIAWDEEDFRSHFAESNCIGLVIEQDEIVLGFMIYELHDKHLELVILAVRQDFRRRYIGTRLIQKLKTKLSEHRRRAITVALAESNLPGQLFFRSLGFKAVHIVRGAAYNGEDIYLMRHTL